MVQEMVSKINYITILFSSVHAVARPLKFN